MHLGSKLSERVVLIGVLAGGFGTAVAILPGGFSPFGPAKAFVLLAGVTLVALGFEIDPAWLADAARRAVRQRGVWPALGLVGVAALSTATSVDPSQSLLGHYPEYRGLALLLAAAAIGFGAYALAPAAPDVPTRRGAAGGPRAAGLGGAVWSVFGRAAVVALLAIAAYALLQLLRLDPVPYARALNVRRVFSTSGNASNLGVILLMLLPLALVRARVERGAWRVAAWLAVAGGVVALAWSLSRGAWAGAVVGALVWLAIELRSRPNASRWRVAFVASAAIVAALALAIALVPNAAGRLGAALDPSSGTIGWRAEVWTASAKMVAERPLLGFGPASFRYAFPPRRTASMIGGDSANQIADDPHNLLASTAVASGAVALALLVWLLAESLVAAWRAAPASGRAAGSATAPASTRAARSATAAPDPWPLAAPALAAGIAAATTALMFHFATLDSAPMLAALIGLALGRVPQVPPQPSASVTLVARVAAIAVTALAVTCALLALGLVAADVQVARGFAHADDSATPWTDADAAFAAAEGLAPWEPALAWAAGRAATQRVSSGDGNAAPDALAALAQASDRLPADPLLLAQSAEAYLVVGQATSDRTAVERSRELAERAVEADPENGYRWALKGSALAALGETEAALDALQKAVTLVPDDAHAWTALSGIYTRMGDPAKADAARTKAAALGAGR